MTDRVETAGRRVERFAEVSLSVWEMRHSYEDRMKVVSVPILIHPPDSHKYSQRFPTILHLLPLGPSSQISFVNY